MRIYCGWGSDLIPHSEVTGRGSDLVSDSEVVQTVTYPPESEDTGRNSDHALKTTLDFRGHIDRTDTEIMQTIQ